MLYALPNTRGFSHCLLSYERRVGVSFFCVQIVDLRYNVIQHGCEGIRG